MAALYNVQEAGGGSAWEALTLIAKISLSASPSRYPAEAGSSHFVFDVVPAIQYKVRRDTRVQQTVTRYQKTENVQLLQQQGAGSRRSCWSFIVVQDCPLQGEYETTALGREIVRPLTPMPLRAR